MKHNWSNAFVILLLILTLFYSLFSTVIHTYGLTQPSNEVTTEEIVELDSDTHLVRVVEVVKGRLNRKYPTINHIIGVISPGQLDIKISYVGKSAPKISISNFDFKGTSGTFDVTNGDYILTLTSTSTSNLNFTATITYPEKEVPVDIPLGDPKIILYGQDDNSFLWYIYLGVTLLIFIALGYLFKTKRISYNKNT